jgi:hypothetical protein
MATRFQGHVLSHGGYEYSHYGAAVQLVAVCTTKGPEGWYERHMAGRGANPLPSP